MTHDDALSAPSSWDAAIQAHGGHFLQSAAWLAVQQRLGYDAACLEGSGWRGLGVLLRRRVGAYAYFPYGPVLERPDAGPAMIAELAQWAKSEKISFCRIEPEGMTEQACASHPRLAATRDIQPRATWTIDLRCSTDDLKAGLRTRLRGYVNTGEKRGLSLRTGTIDDLDTFSSLLEKTAENRFDTHGRAYYATVYQTLAERGAGSLTFADHDGIPVAAVMSFDSPATRYYAHVAVDEERNRSLHASAWLAWRLILDAKETGRTAYDFWGVLAEEIPGHPWNGFTTFKKSFGGSLVRRSGTWDLPVSAIGYSTNRLARTLRR